MPSLGPAEILVILVVALLVFGPNKMPEIARQLGRGMRELRRMQQHLSTEFHDVMADFDSGTEPAPPATPGGDPPPTLPPRALPPVVPQASPPPATSPAPPASSPGSSSPSDPSVRGARVWPPPPDAPASPAS
jgi:sec-independent protein translocase protein TatA